MPRRGVHLLVGVPAGTLCAATLSKGLGQTQQLAEVAGGGLGGYYGALLPDIIEPSYHPRHRALAHSAVLGGSLALAAQKRVDKLQAACRTRAAAAARDRVMFPIGTPEYNWCVVLEHFYHFLAGLLVGLLIGYLSHLALDALTPSSLPILGLSCKRPCKAFGR
jgi:hypothetical protein